MNSLFKLYLEDERGNSICFSNSAREYMASSVEGLSPPTATISSSSYAGMDGSYISNAAIDKRNVVIKFSMQGSSVAIRRKLLYDVVKPRKSIKVHYRTRMHDVYADGYVETCEIDNYSSKATGQISIICPDVYWYDVESTSIDANTTIAGFEFPFAIEETGIPFSTYDVNRIVRFTNAGEDTGIQVVVDVTGDVSNPMIYDEDTEEYIKILGDYKAGDTITINTVKMHKSITLLRDGTTSNIINKMAKGSTWLELGNGSNRFSIHADSGIGNLHTTIVFRTCYLGV